MTANYPLFSQVRISSRRRLRLPSGRTESGLVWPGNPLTPLSTTRDFPSLQYLYTCWAYYPPDRKHNPYLFWLSGRPA